MVKKTAYYIKIAAIIVMLVIIGVFIASQFRHEEVVFELDDRCGPIVNMISHSIPDETSCRTNCIAKCESKDLDFKEIDFVVPEAGCNNCTCYCIR